jgi:N4-gp56 family major capsid protein
MTKINELVNPMVMADAISARIGKKIVVSPFAKIDETLSGVPGDTVYVPQYSYIGDADDIAEGSEVGTSKLVASTTKATIKKAMKAVELTDEAVLSGYGNPVGETSNQLAAAIAAKVDADAMDALQDAKLSFDSSTEQINYNGIVDAIDVFEEESNSEKVMFIHPKQMTQLRHDENFISADKYPGAVVMTGEIGMIANTRIVPSKRVPLNEELSERYEFCSENDADALLVTEADTAEDGEVLISDVLGDLKNAVAGDYVKLADAVSKGTYYLNPIVKIETDTELQDEAPALTIYIKRDTNVEAQRQSLRRVTDISVDKLYTVALSNAAKVVLAKFKK